MKPRILMLIFCTTSLLSAYTFSAESGLTSSHEVMAASNDISGYHIAPVTDIQGQKHEGDLATSQILEIVRPNLEAFTVSRLAVSCDCLKLTMEKRTFTQGERAFLEVRNIEATPPEGATYIVFVKLDSPISEALQHFIFVKSGE